MYSKTEYAVTTLIGCLVVIFILIFAWTPNVIWDLVSPKKTQSAKKVRQKTVCAECDDYKSQLGSIRDRLKTIKKTQADLRLQAEKDGLGDPPADLTNEKTWIYWDESRNLTHRMLHLQQEEVDMIVLRHHHVVIDILERLD